MPTDIVLTVTGPDRIGIVEEVTGTLLELGANIGTSRMARLGGEFAIILLATLPEGSAEDVEAAFEGLIAEGYRASTVSTGREAVVDHSDWPRYRIEVRGADHEGIIHEVARELSRLGINIESAETGTVSAPVTGVPLFFMKTLVDVPPELDETAWLEALDEVAGVAGVDIDVVLEPEDATGSRNA